MIAGLDSKANIMPEFSSTSFRQGMPISTYHYFPRPGLTDLKDQFDDFRESTIGAAFLTQTISIDDNTTVKFEIWDTAGMQLLVEMLPEPGANLLQARNDTSL